MCWWETYFFLIDFVEHCDWWALESLSESSWIAVMFLDGYCHIRFFICCLFVDDGFLPSSLVLSFSFSIGFNFNFFLLNTFFYYRFACFYLLCQNEATCFGASRIILLLYLFLVHLILVSYVYSYYTAAIHGGLGQMMPLVGSYLIMHWATGSLGKEPLRSGRNLSSQMSEPFCIRQLRQYLNEQNRNFLSILFQGPARLVQGCHLQWAIFCSWWGDPMVGDAWYLWTSIYSWSQVCAKARNREASHVFH